MTIFEAKMILENGKAPDEMVQKFANLHGVDLFDAEMASFLLKSFPESSEEWT